MSRKRPEYLANNLPQLIKLCKEHDYEYERMSMYQYRIMAATHIIDIWPSRMVFHRLSGESIRSYELYPRVLDEQFNKDQVSKLLATGEF